MKKRWYIILYLFTHILSVLRIIFINRKKEQNKLAVKELKIEVTNTTVSSNNVNLLFKQAGSILVVIQDKFVFPIFSNEGKISVPTSLLTSKDVYVTFIGLFQSRIKKITLNALPINIVLNKPAIKTIRKGKTKPFLFKSQNLSGKFSLLNLGVIQNTFNIKPHVKLLRISEPSLKSTFFRTKKPMETLTTLNEAQTIEKLKIKSHEK